MASSRASASVSDLRRRAAKLLARIRTSEQPVVIMQRGRATAMLLGVEHYGAMKREREILRRIARGDREISGRSGASLMSAIADADKQLKR